MIDSYKNCQIITAEFFQLMHAFS